MTVNSVSVVAPQKQTGGVGKAVASAFVPGLGQFLDGRNKEAILFGGANLASICGGAALANSIGKDTFKMMNKVPVKEGILKCKQIGMIALLLSTAVLFIANIVDAYKGGKNKA